MKFFFWKFDLLLNQHDFPETWNLKGCHNHQSWSELKLSHSFFDVVKMFQNQKGKRSNDDCCCLFDGGSALLRYEAKPCGFVIYNRQISGSTRIMTYIGSRKEKVLEWQRRLMARETTHLQQHRIWRWKVAKWVRIRGSRDERKKSFIILRKLVKVAEIIWPP